MSFQTTGFYGNTNVPRIMDGRQDIQYITNNFAETQNNLLQWTQGIYSTRFQTVKQAGQTKFLFGVSEFSIDGPIDNINNGNNVFSWIEQRTDIVSAPVTITVHVPNGFYTVAQLATEIQALMNANTTMAGGTYAVTVTGTAPQQFINIALTPPGGQTWIFSLPTNVNRVIGLLYITLGLQNNGPETSSGNMAGIRRISILAGVDSCFLSCDALQYSNPLQVNDVNSISTLFTIPPIVCRLPGVDSSGVTGSIEYQFMNIEWHETSGNPFQNAITWSITNIYGDIMTSAGASTILATLRVELLGENNEI